MLLLANGDSNTYGHGLSDQGTDPAQWPKDHSDQTYALQHSWPAQLAKKLGWEHVNLSRPGGSNDRIVRTTLQYLTREKPKNTVMIIGWTEATRREVHVNEHGQTSSFPNEDSTNYKSFTIDRDEMQTSMHSNYSAVKWARNYRRYGWDEIESHVRCFQQMILMQSYCRDNNIALLNWCLHRPHFWMKKQITEKNQYAIDMTKSLYDSVEWKNFAGYNKLNPIRMDNWIYRQFINGTVSSIHVDPTMHPTELGHSVIAEKLLDELKQRKLI